MCRVLGLRVFFIGACRFQSEMTQFFHGALDDVGIYDRALTAAEIGALHSVEPNVPAYTISGAVVTDLTNPLGSGLAGVQGDGGTFQAQTAAGQGYGRSMTYRLATTR